MESTGSVVQGLERGAESGALAGFGRGVRDCLSLVIGIFPVGMAFGIAAREYGFSALDASLLSLLVFAGASQFIGIALIASGAGILEVAVTTFFVNLRHALMSASLSVYLRECGRGFLSLLAFGITDETFGLSISRYARGERSPWYLLGTNLLFYSAWNAGTVAGHLAGSILPATLRSGMSFALPAVFVSLLVLSCRDRTTVIVALFSAAVSMALYLGNVGFGNVVLVGAAGATLGLVLERWKGK
ncbi:MAG TPA: AzlC family ABC transporter permease [Chloroflexota bacterium]